MHPLRLAIQRFDHWLCRQYGVYAFCQAEGVILRVQQGSAAHDLLLPDGCVPRGRPVLLLHFWNERLPPIPPAGPDLEYAVRLRRGLIRSLQAIAVYLAQTPCLETVQAVGGVTAHVTLERPNSGRALLNSLGFTLFPYHRPAGAFGEFWENFYTWWLMWAFNPASVRHRPLWKLQRLEFWMTRQAFLRRYAPPSVDPPRSSC